MGKVRNTYKHLGYRVAWLWRHSRLSSGWGHQQTRHPRPPAGPAEGTLSQKAAAPIVCTESKQMKKTRLLIVILSSSNWKMLQLINWAVIKYYLLKYRKIQNLRKHYVSKHYEIEVLNLYGSIHDHRHYTLFYV